MMTDLLEHDRQSWSGSRTEVESMTAWSDPGMNRLKDAAEKIPITLIRWRILMQIVYRFFVRW